MILWASSFLLPKQRIIGSYNLDFTNVAGAGYRFAKLRGYLGIREICHSGFFQLVCNVFGSFVWVAAVFYAFSFNDGFVETFFGGLN